MKINKLYLNLFLVLGLLLAGCNSGSSDNATGDAVYSGEENKEKNCITEQVPYEEEEKYMDQEEYVKTEYYSETVPYTDTECENQNLIYKVDKGSCTSRKDNIFSDDIPAEYSCSITNLDAQAGQFLMRIGFNVDGQQLEETQPKYIYPQSSETFIIRRDATIQGCFCVEQVPKKQVCRDVTNYQEVQKSRDVTAFRPVERTRTVTRYKEKVTCS